MSRRTALSLVWIILLLFVSGGLAAPTLSSGAQTRPGYAGKLEAYLQAQMKTYKIPGLAVAIVRDGEVQYINGFGKANSHGDPVTADTPFLLASVSKSITAVGIMQLVEASKVRLDAPVRDYLPWFEVGGSGGDITVAELLYQTSGLAEIAGQKANLRRDAPDALEAGVRDLAQDRLNFAPGSDWEYSNLNYNVLGLIIQQVSGQSYEDYIAANVVRYSRLLFGAVAALLTGVLAFTLAKNRAHHRLPAAGALLMLAASIILSAGLLGMIYLRLLPENGVNLPVLVRGMPDVGLLIILITLLSLSWIVMSVALLANLRSQRRKIAALAVVN